MSKESRNITVALAGQPNSGKSTIFNLLTGARQFVANYPGVTVEKKTGIYRYKGKKIVVVDLPGTYSLTSYSLEERIARNFLLHEKPAVVVDVVDASNLERNLYLSFQIREMGVPTVIALNMMDVARGRGFQIDTDELSWQIGAEVVPTVGNKGRGKNELKEAIWKTFINWGSGPSPLSIDYGKALEPILSSLEKKLSEHLIFSKCYPTRWLAVKLMENDSEAQRIVRELYETARTGKESKI